MNVDLKSLNVDPESLNVDPESLNVDPESLDEYPAVIVVDRAAIINSTELPVHSVNQHADGTGFADQSKKNRVNPSKSASSACRHHPIGRRGGFVPGMKGKNDCSHKPQQGVILFAASEDHDGFAGEVFRREFRVDVGHFAVVDVSSAALQRATGFAFR